MSTETGKTETGKSGPGAEDSHDVKGADKSASGPASRSRVSAVLISLTLALVIVAVLSACIGQVPTSPLEVLGSILHRIGLDLGPMPAHPSGEVTLWEVRFPASCSPSVSARRWDVPERYCKVCSPIRSPSPE
ncbi:hypothetical protein GCM10020255_083130 [Rhodococcus baikonurensis]